MTSSSRLAGLADRARDLGDVVRFGYRQYFAANPPTVVLTTEWPRAIFQCAFFTVLGLVVAGPGGERFAFVGTLVMAQSLSTVGIVGDIVVTEKWSGTFFRIRMGRFRPVTTFLLRAGPNVTQGLAACLLCLFLVGPLTGNASLVVPVLRAFPLFVLMAVTGAVAGLTVCSAAIGRRADVVAVNAFLALLNVAAGLLVPVGQIRWLDAVGRLLPLRNGTLAVRAYLNHHPWTGYALAEMLVGVGWTVACVLLYTWQTRRSYRLGLDNLA